MTFEKFLSRMFALKWNEVTERNVVFWYVAPCSLTDID